MIQEIKDQKQFDRLAPHPLQSWAWGEFRAQTGIDVLRLGQFDAKNQLTHTYQITFHQIPHLPFTIAYIPKSDLPTPELLTYLKAIAEKRKTILFKFEPNLCQAAGSSETILSQSRQTLTKLGLMSGKALFTQYSFILDLNQSEEKLLSLMKAKTRYNTRLAEKKGVVVLQDDSDQAFNDYLDLTFKETTVRQKFYAHDPHYHRLMWQNLHQAGIAHLFRASYLGQALVTWIVFVFHHTLYYPYGASSSAHRNLMASNLMMWEVIKFGQKMGCTQFDMWGSLGPDPDPNDPWIGFHSFKQGYGPTLMEFTGSYDHVTKPKLYKIYTLAEKLRWLLLRLKKKISR